jgi:hypothetical protein
MDRSDRCRLVSTVQVGGGVTRCGLRGGPRFLVSFVESRSRMCSQTAADGPLQTKLVRLGRDPLLVVDEVGYIPFEPEAPSNPKPRRENKVNVRPSRDPFVRPAPGGHGG